MSIELGKYNVLEVVKEVEFGMYLDGGEDGEILLPLRYVPEGCQPGDLLNVFIYLDNEERLVATTLTSLVQVGEFACLEVAWVNEYGAFLNWGLMKDLFVPFREQKMKMQVGKKYVIHAHLDDESYRIVASAKVDRYLSKEAAPYHRVKAFIKQIREDGKIDLILQKPGFEKVDDFSKTLLQYIKDNGGRIALNDKSPADEIYSTFGVSKKTFKKGVGDLYKKHLILLPGDGIVLVTSPKS